MREGVQSEKNRKLKYLESLSEQQLFEISEEQFNTAKVEFREFKEAFSLERCSKCEKPLATFSAKSPCLHWLLNPKGFKKKNFPAIADKFGFEQIVSYLRWVANQDGFARNINDLSGGEDKKLISLTIKYKTREWSFSCAESDFNGHARSRNARYPHYHFQMRINGRPFINYNDFHLAFSDEDLTQFEALRRFPDKVRGAAFFGEGMKDVFNVENIVNDSVPTDDGDEAAFHLQTIAVAKDGETISMDDVYKIFKKARESGVNNASLLKDLPKSL